MKIYKIILWLLFHLFWALFPWIVVNTIATMATGWWVIPIFVGNAFIQGWCFSYRIKR